MTKLMKFGVGQGVKRVEDVRLVSGRGNYASDAVESAELRAVFLRSPHGHAKFRIDDIEAARAAPGVRAVYVAERFRRSRRSALPGAGRQRRRVEDAAQALSGHGGRTRSHHVGDIVAMAVADTALQARDAAEPIGVDWEELPAAVDMEAGRSSRDAPLVFAGAPGNVAYDAHIGDKHKTDAAFAQRGAQRSAIKIVNPRVVANFMEPRSAVGEYDAATGRLTLNVGSQGVHGFRSHRRATS